MKTYPLDDVIAELAPEIIVEEALMELYQQAHDEVMTDKEFSEFVKQSSDPIHTYSALVINRFKRLVREVINE